MNPKLYNYPAWYPSDTGMYHYRMYRGDSILQHFIERRVREFSTKKKMRFVYQILFRTAAMYQSTLRIIDKREPTSRKISAEILKMKTL